MNNADFWESINGIVADGFTPEGLQRLDHYAELLIFYHSDHLGSASWITEINGDAVQHLQYLPYGERYVDQRVSGYHERFTFTGKERDEETGYGYFGARYMDHELMTMWLSVDPLADKYPSISPYAYCAWNPIKLVDPNGNEAIENDDWFQNTLTGAVYYNQSMSAQDVGTGAMRGDGWEHLGENNMFSNGDYSNSDIQLVMRYGGSLGVHDDFVDIPPALMLEGDNAKDFMSDRGYSLQPQEAIAVTTTRTTMASEPHEPITLTETNTYNIKVNKWGYEKKGLKGYPSVIKNISFYVFHISPPVYCSTSHIVTSILRLLLTI